LGLHDKAKLIGRALTVTNNDTDKQAPKWGYLWPHFWNFCVKTTRKRSMVEQQFANNWFDKLSMHS